MFVLLFSVMKQIDEHDKSYLWIIPVISRLIL